MSHVRQLHIHTNKTIHRVAEEAASDKLQMSPSSVARTVHRFLSPGPTPTQRNAE